MRGGMIYLSIFLQTKRLCLVHQPSSPSRNPSRKRPRTDLLIGHSHPLRPQQVQSSIDLVSFLDSRQPIDIVPSFLDVLRRVIATDIAHFSLRSDGKNQRGFTRHSMRPGSYVEILLVLDRRHDGKRRTDSG